MALSETAITWLEARGIDPELADRLGVDSADRGGGEWIKIPYFKSGEVVNHKYRCITEKKHSQDKDAAKCFWNYDVITDQSLADHPVMIFEGEFDAMIALQCGYPRSISVPDGAPAQEVGEEYTGSKYSYWFEAEADFANIKTVILATDADDAGEALFNDLSVRIGKSRVKRLRYPKGCKDLNEAFQRYNQKGVDKTIDRAEFCYVGGIYRMSELPPRPYRQAYSTGKTWLDPHYNIRMGDFCVVTGRPGDGKSTFINDLMCSVVEQYGWVVAFASFEQDPQDDHKRALREWYAKVPETHMANHERELADDWIDKHFVFIVPHWEDQSNLDWVMERCAAAVVRYGAKVIVIDPWNEMDHDKPHNLSLTEYTGQAIKRFKRLATGLNVHVIVIAHPTKMGTGERPGLYSISDSAHWANKPEIGIIVYKPERDRDLAEITVAKSRYHDQIGKPGTVMTEYMALTRRFQKAIVTDDEQAGEAFE